ncbi:MAG: hypothetical protein HY689_00180 [Chloroflexi bacterium]|nr:hypothetical protein [Chloroflexota bacterium]
MKPAAVLYSPRPEPGLNKRILHQTRGGSDIAGCRLWVAADNIGPQADGNLISTWTDQSGQGNHLTTSGTTRPTFQNDIVNGKPVVRFDGSNDELKSTAASLINVFSGNDLPHTVIAVIRLRGASGGNDSPWIWASKVSSTQRHFYGAHLGNSSHLLVRSDDSAQTTTTEAGTVSQNWHIYSWVFSGTAISLFRSRSTIVSSSAMDRAAVTVDEFRLGGSKTGADPIDIAEVVIYNTALSAANREQVERYLSVKYGITVVA